MNSDFLDEGFNPMGGMMVDLRSVDSVEETENYERFDLFEPVTPEQITFE